MFNFDGLKWFVMFFHQFAPALCTFISYPWTCSFLLSGRRLNEIISWARSSPSSVCPFAVCTSCCALRKLYSSSSWQGGREDTHKCIKPHLTETAVLSRKKHTNAQKIKKKNKRGGELRMEGERMKRWGRTREVKREKFKHTSERTKCQMSHGWSAKKGRIKEVKTYKENMIEGRAEQEERVINGAKWTEIKITFCVEVLILWFV